MRAFGLVPIVVSLFGSSPVLAQTPGPVPTSMSEDGAPPKTDTFDVAAAKKELSAVDYKDCGKGGPGKILVTFSTDGTIERVVLAEGTWQPEVAVCVTRRFAAISVTPFVGGSHTVKYAVQLEGGVPAPPPSYAAPVEPRPTYNPYMVPNKQVMDAHDGPTPSGYHVEERRRSGSLITGSILSGMGLVFGYLALNDSRSFSDTVPLLAVVHLAVGIPMFCVGLSTKKVFVADRMSVVPSVNRTGASATLSISF